jgi:hypothetical protein
MPFKVPVGLASLGRRGDFTDDGIADDVDHRRQRHPERRQGNLDGVPGTYGSIASAAPPRTTLNPPRMPRASLLYTPRHSRRCEYQAVASIATALPPAGSAPGNPIQDVSGR